MRRGWGPRTTGYLCVARHGVVSSRVGTRFSHTCSRTHARTHARTHTVRARETRCDVTGYTRTLARGRVRPSVRTRDPYTRPASDAYRCVNARECSPDSALAIARLRRESIGTLCTRTRVREREIKREGERAHVYSRVCALCRLCARLVHKSVGSPPSGATLHLLLPLGFYLLLLPAGPADTHVYVYLGLQCKIWTSGERTLLLYHYHCHRPWPFVRARSCRLVCREHFASALMWYREGGRGENYPDLARSTNHTCMYRYRV